ncbi:MAG: hypothetical protein HZA20_06960 [Nitrospirae bacterium]|jgi:predicted RNA-binding Zn-ribbon protein involved in translation (DUF1610 family)|nr:hypothetical protein [Nitrospirota bacterium]
MSQPSVFKEKSPCSTRTAAAPEMVECPVCGEKVEIWSDEEEATCPECGITVTRQAR